METPENYTIEHLVPMNKIRFHHVARRSRTTLSLLHILGKPGALKTTFSKVTGEPQGRPLLSVSLSISLNYPNSSKQEHLSVNLTSPHQEEHGGKPEFLTNSILFQGNERFK